MAKPPPKVSGRVLEWARKRASLSREEVAEFLRLRTVDASTVERWERTEQSPTPAQLRRLAQRYRIPERWFLLDEPPTQYDDLGVVDYRTAHLGRLANPSLNLRGAIEHALAIQAWVIEHRAASGDEPVHFVAAKSTKHSPRAVARYIDELFGVSQLRDIAKDASDFFERFRQRVEDQGVLVLKMGQVANKTAWPLNPDEFKGFTLIDEDHLAPLVFINRKDHDDAQLFTFVHELAHVVTGGSGVSNEDIEDLSAEKPNVEVFCDAVASEVLVPTREFEYAWNESEGSGAESLTSIAATFKVTPLILARRAADTRKISERSFHSHAREWRRTPPRISGKGGPPPDRTTPSWYGRRLAELLAAAASTGHPAASDALDLLGVKLDVARKIVERSDGPTRGAKPKSAHRPLPPMGRFDPVRLDASWKNRSRLES
jgi:Zn-dependent peptidase ImmA (M78 family)